MQHTWISDAADLLSIGTHWPCQAGHIDHDVIEVDIKLNGPILAVPDFPSIPERFACSFSMKVCDGKRYGGSGYCPGDDETSRSLETQGIWEGFNTVLVMDILAGAEPGIVLDFGAHVGWFSILAMMTGREVLAVEAEPTFVDLLRSNVTELVTVAHGWIDENTPQLLPGPRIRFLKSDVEGAEDQVVRVCDPLFAAGLIDFALLEVSPCLASHYPDTVQRIVDHGYSAHIVPDKGTDITEFSADPLGVTMQHRIDGPEMRHIIEQLRQEDILFVRKD